MSQSDDIRGKLLVEQEKLRKEIDQLTSELKNVGSYLRLIGEKIANDPSRVTFSNHDKFVFYQSGPLAGRVADHQYNEFKEAMNSEDIITKIIALRAKIHDLHHVQQKLANK